ncbi:MAG: heme biosynthesis HemY N-terminal domain-containing protein, partial [Pseudohongiellaceae bacterium]
MIKLFLYSIAALVVALGVTLFLARDPGYLLVSYGQYTFETSLFALLIALIVLLLLWQLLVTVLAWINPMNWLSYGRSWSANRSLQKQLQKDAAAEVEETLFIQQLEAVRSANPESQTTLRELRKFWKKNAKHHAGDPDVLCAYVDALVTIGEVAEAITLLENALNKQWETMLIRRYSLLSLDADDAAAVKQLECAERWLQDRSRDAELLLALGRLSLRAQLWGKAKDYLERSLRTKPDPEVFAELARLLLSLKEPERDAQ